MWRLWFARKTLKHCIGVLVRQIQECTIYRNPFVGQSQVIEPCWNMQKPRCCAEDSLWSRWSPDACRGAWRLNSLKEMHVCEHQDWPTFLSWCHCVIVLRSTSFMSMPLGIKHWPAGYWKDMKKLSRNKGPFDMSWTFCLDLFTNVQLHKEAFCSEDAESTRANKAHERSITECMIYPWTEKWHKCI